jgi:hypothetical protein
MAGAAVADSAVPASAVAAPITTVEAIAIVRIRKCLRIELAGLLRMLRPSFPWHAMYGWGMLRQFRYQHAKKRGVCQ